MCVCVCVCVFVCVCMSVLIYSCVYGRGLVFVGQPTLFCVLQKDLSKPLMMDNIDSSSGVLHPYYDDDRKVVYVAGKVCCKFAV